MKDKISVVIPVRNKELWRIKEVTKRLENPVIKEIIIVDYNSNAPIELKQNKIRIIRYNKKGHWNKAHAINIGVKRAKGDYIISMDADILLGPKIFDKIESLINNNTFIYTNQVRRIEKEDLAEEWEYNLKRSTPWKENQDIMQEVNSTATGGFQLFPKKFFLKIRGLDENLVFYGGMDNTILIDARRNGLDVTCIGEKILHLEHKNLKEENIPEEERSFALFVKKHRLNLIKRVINLGNQKNPNFWGSLSKPNDYIVKDYKKVFDRMSVEEGESFELPRETKIMIAVINNRDSLPERFVQNLMGLFFTTSNIFPNTEIHYFKKADVNGMRNMAVMKAIDRDFDYITQLDTDHDYPENFILRLIGRNKDFITGCTRRKMAPYYPTQYKEFKMPLLKEDNFVYSNGKGNIFKIGASGPVGMLMRVRALKELEFPYFHVDNSYYIMTLKKHEKEDWTYYPRKNQTPLGGDYYFCKKIKENHFELWLDPSLEFPHYAKGLVRGIGKGSDGREFIVDIF